MEELTLERKFPSSSLMNRKWPSRRYRQLALAMTGELSASVPAHLETLKGLFRYAASPRESSIAEIAARIRRLKTQAM